MAETGKATVGTPKGSGPARPQDSAAPGGPGAPGAPGGGPAGAKGADEPAVELRQRLRPDGTLVGDAEVAVPEDVLRKIYRTMCLVRAIDERMIKLQRQGRIGFYGQAAGQEAGAVASAAALEPGDWLFPALREGGAALYRGMPLDVFIAQNFGSAMDEQKGRQMPCHYSWREGNFVGLSSVIASQVPHATGAAMAAKIRGDDTVVLGYLGDGATSEGDFHVGLNFAGVYDSPVVFFCQNNQWAISVPFAGQTASESIAVKAEAYGFPGVRIDGNDALVIYEETRKAVDRARRGEGPTLIEAVTYRLEGHSSSDDPTRYRDPKEVEAWREKDPIVRLRAYLVGRGLWDDAREAAMAEEIGAEISEAVERVEKDPPPADGTLIEDVYSEIPPHLREQFEQR